MKKVLFLMALIASCISLNAQEVLKQHQEEYQNATQEERKKMDELYQPLADKWLLQQVKSLGGIPFGITREKAGKMLEKKFGKAAYYPSSTTLVYKNIKYAGHDFDAVNFLFQSDGVNSYLNCCIFVINTKSLQEAIEKEKYIAENLLSKYQMFEDKDDYGNPTHGGGLSPLWDGKWHTLDIEKFGVAIHTNILKYDEDLVQAFDFPYAVRIIYGPYNYIQEEF